jgi:hypothetical protein
MTIKKALNPHRGPITAVIVLALLILVAIGVKAYVSRNPGPVASNPQPLIPTHGPVQVVRFTLYDAGIYPRQARVDKGLVAITIEDLSGGTSGVVVERLNDTAREHVGDVHRFQNHWRGREEIRLQAGNYRLYMADRPNNRALLVVEP